MKLKCERELNKATSIPYKHSLDTKQSCRFIRRNTVGTGAYSKYLESTLGWQHWLSPQIEFRPEIDHWRSLDTKAFNGDNAIGLPGNKNYTGDGRDGAIIHF